MSNTLVINSAFAGTTVDPAQAKGYLFNIDCKQLRAAIQRGASEPVITSLYHTEVLELELRFYVAGCRPTLHRVFSEIRLFHSRNPVVAAGMIRLTIIRMRRHFLKNEWYELIPRLEHASAKIERLLAQS